MLTGFLIAFAVATVIVGMICALDRPVKDLVEGGLRECHPAPTNPYTPKQAHEVMQELIGCDTHSCAAKHDAFWTLVDAGRVTPAVRAVR